MDFAVPVETSQLDSHDTFDTHKPTRESCPSTHNPRLNREIKNAATMAVFCTSMLTMDVLKSISGYGMKYYNGGLYPISPTLIVALTELLKFVVFLILFVKNEGGLRHIRISVSYALPAVTYVIGNNVHLLALHYTTPPIWTMLMQLRVVLTALAYRLLFRRAMRMTQWIALACLVTAISLSNWEDVTTHNGKHQLNFIVSLFLASLASVLSVTGSLVMEFLLKNDRRQFIDKQTQIYLFSSICALGVYVSEAFVINGSDSIRASSLSTVVLAMLICHQSMACFGGFMVAIVIKKFDNIVKQYTQALANMFTAIACSLLFPEYFNLTYTFGLCTVLAIIAIFMYESRTVCTSCRGNFKKRVIFDSIDV